MNHTTHLKKSTDPVSTQSTCPVCQVEKIFKGLHCPTCSWYFPLEKTDQYGMELSRAKQQFHLNQTLNILAQKMDNQLSILEKIGDHLGKLNQNVKTFNQVATLPKVDLPKYDYPARSPILKVADFDTTEKRAAWWKALESQWQKAFAANVLKKEQNHQPTDEEIVYILESPSLHIIGASGTNTLIDFELTNLSGIKHLTDIKLLVLTHHQISSLEGIEHLEKLEILFVNSNQLSNLKELHYLPALTQLYCIDNQITDLYPLIHSTKLTTLNCAYNQLNSLIGIGKEHAANLKSFVCLPNEKVSSKEINRVEALSIQCKKG